MAGIAVGDEFDASLVLADVNVPEELHVRLVQSFVAQTAWNQLPESKKRAIMEHIRSGKSASARERRAAFAAEQLVIALG